MAFLYFEDDNPFPEEFANNYIYFNEKDPEAKMTIHFLKNLQIIIFISMKKTLKLSVWL